MRSIPLVKTLIIVFCFLAGAIDAAKVPARFKKGGDDAGGNMAMMEEFIGGGDEEAIEEKGGEGRGALANVEIAGARDEGIEELGAAD